VFEKRFSVSRMAEDYVAVYEKLLEEDPQPLAPTTVPSESPEGHGTGGGLLLTTMDPLLGLENV
jgi:hypothetical protein